MQAPEASIGQNSGAAATSAAHGGYYSKSTNSNSSNGNNNNNNNKQDDKDKVPAAQAHRFVQPVVNAGTAAGCLGSSSLEQKCQKTNNDNGDSAFLLEQQQQQAAEQRTQQQRIKVTLSAAPPSRRDSLFGAELDSSNEKRQSTATLISASLVSAASSTTSTPTANPTLGGAGQKQPQQQQQQQQQSKREKQENELRRIASQRRTTTSGERAKESFSYRNTNEQTEVRAAAEEEAASAHKSGQQQQKGHNQASVESRPPILGPSDALGINKQQQQQQTSGQLAIYMNGKLRSNSIFCTRSTSSTSFSSIIKSFAHSEQDRRIRAAGKSQSGAEAQAAAPSSPATTTTTTTKAKAKAKTRQEAERRQTSSGGGGEGGAVKSDNDAQAATSSEQEQQQKSNGAQLNLRALKRLLPAARRFSGSAKKRRPSPTCQQTNPAPIRPNELDGRPHGTRAASLSSAIAGGQSGATRISEPSLGRTFSSPKTAHEEQGQQEDTDNNNNKQANCYKLNPSSMFLRKAMRYYRLWIYSANLIILLAAIVFVLATIYVASDERIGLLVDSRWQPNVEPQAAWTSSSSSKSDATESGASDPFDAFRRALIAGQITSEQSVTTAAEKSGRLHIGLGEWALVLAYAIVSVQLGVLQAIGCFGAIRMKEKWIQAFWYLILLLVIADLGLLVYWMQRYDLLVHAIRDELSVRLADHYGWRAAKNGAAANTVTATNNPVPIITTTTGTSTRNFDKIFTEIFDQIQTDSQCCGVSGPLDYKHSQWRLEKLFRLSSVVMDQQQSNGNNNDSLDLVREQLINVLRRVPLVPATCCRRRPSTTPANTIERSFAYLDDTQIANKVRVPAWSPSMAIGGVHPSADDSVHHAASQQDASSGPEVAEQESGQEGEEEDASVPDDEDDGQPRATLANMIDRSRRPAGLHEAEWLRTRRRRSSRDDGRTTTSEHETSNGRRYARNTTNSASASEWAISGRVDERGQVLEQIVGEQSAGTVKAGLEHEAATQQQQQQITSRPRTFSNYELAQMRRKQLQELRALLIDEHSHELRQPNQLGLSIGQFRTIEGFLVNELRTIGRRRRRHHHDDDDHHHLYGDGRAKKARRSIDVGASENNNNQHTTNNNRQNIILERLAKAIEHDPELGCLPRSYYDQSRINTRACQPHVRAWLSSSASVLFVTGFCVLTVLKFCSLILLRLEIREMVHKIRVLKGMATEYNALQDLEPYLPRPSFSMQPAELTPVGVAPAIGPQTGVQPPVPSGAATTAAATSAGSAQSPTGATGGGIEPPSSLVGPAAAATRGHHQLPQRIGGSFSEAVVAATAAAQQQRQQQALASSLANCARATSMKTMLLDPSGRLCCPRSSSVSVAHSLQGGVTAPHHQQQLAASANLLGAHSALFPSTMPRRHTAVSVCPAAAAAAAAAAQHLMARRSTYALANPLTFTPTGAAAAAVAPARPLNTQHRHSAHALQAQYDGNGVAHQQHQLPTTKLHAHSTLGAVNLSAGNAPQINKRTGRQQQAAQQEHKNTRLKPNSCQQTSQGATQFKRQSSGGAQSAVNFSLDISPVQLTESRRSIH